MLVMDSIEIYPMIPNTVYFGVTWRFFELIYKHLTLRY